MLLESLIGKELIFGIGSSAKIVDSSNSFYCLKEENSFTFTFKNKITKNSHVRRVVSLKTFSLDEEENKKTKSHSISNCSVLDLPYISDKSFDNLALWENYETKSPLKKRQKSKIKI